MEALRGLLVIERRDMASQTVAERLRNVGDFEDVACCRDCAWCAHGSHPWELMGDEELRESMSYSYGICYAGDYPRIVELDGMGCE